MERTLPLLLVLLLGIFQSCLQQEQPEVTELEWQEDKKAFSVGGATAFSATLHPELTLRCASCHGEGGVSGIEHSNAQATIAYDVIMEKGLVDLDAPTSSKLYLKANQSHGGYTASASNANAILDAIINWKGVMDSGQPIQPTPPPTNPNAGLTTQQIAFKETLYENVLTKSCSGCHGEGSANTAHSSLDLVDAFNTINSRGFVNLQSPIESEFVKKIAMGHNTIPKSLASDIESYIVAWSERVGYTPVASANENSFKPLYDAMRTSSISCNSCHGNNSANGGNLGFAQDDSHLAYGEVIFNPGLVNLIYPDSSKIVKAVRDGHNCWTSDCNANADYLEALIKNWSTNVGNTPMDNPNPDNLTVSQYSFKGYLYPILTANCVSCHGDNGSIPHSQSDAIAAHDYVVTRNLANLNAPANSELVTKISGGHHNIDTKLAGDIQTAITSWAAAVSADQYPTIPGMGENPPVVASNSEIQFGNTLHPLLKTNCTSCHGDNGAQVKHSASDRAEAFNVMIQRALANLDYPDASAMVAKIKGGHSCWSGNCEVDGLSIQNAITLWSKNIGLNPQPSPDPNGFTDSQRAFSETLHPILKANCTSCHGDSGSYIRHSQTSVVMSHDILVNNNLVQLNNAVDSEVVTKIAGGHNGIATTIAAEMQAAITEWNTRLGGMQQITPKEIQFGTTLHPILKANCASCHGDNGSQMKHSVDDRAEAYSAVVTNDLADLYYPDASAVVAKIKNGHNCWTGDCEADSLVIQNAITVWATNIGLTPMPTPTDPSALNPSELAFSTSLHPVLKANCTSCHGDSGSYIRHAATDAKVAHLNIMNGELVKLNNPIESKIVDKVKNFHNCWSGDCAADAKTLENAISLWANTIKVTSQAEIAFGNTLQPVFMANCTSCHAGNISGLSKHASSDRNEAYTSTVERELANLETPYTSKVVDKIKGGHNCWTGNCGNDAASIQSAITAWSTAMGLNPQGPPNPGGGGSGGTFDRAASAEAFKVSVHPILTTNCSGCHSPDAGSPRAPFHSQPDYVGAHDAVVDTARVDFANIPNSRLVKRLRDDKHYCWNDCTANANEMQSAIEYWASQVDTTGIGQVNGAKTALKGIPSASIELPETIQGTVVMQAEDAVLEGRFTEGTDSQASGFGYIAGAGAPAHPIEGTARAVTLRQSCRAVTDSDLNDSVNGMVRYSEGRRHVNQSGYRFYSMQMSAQIIRPQYRNQFASAIRNGQYADLNRFYLRSGRPSSDNNVQNLNPVPLTRDGGDTGVDNNMIRNFARVLPEFTYYDDWKNSIETNNANYSEFFAPKYGANQDQFWTASESQIRANVPADYLREVTKQVIDQYRDWFFDRRDPDGSGPLPTTNWDAENGIRSLPYTLRTLPNGKQFTTLVYSSAAGGYINRPEALASSIEFFNYYIGQVNRTDGLRGLITYDEAKDDNYSEAYARALTIVDGMPLIMKYVYFFMDPQTRDFNDFNVTHRRADNSTFTRTYDINKGNVNLDLRALYTGGSNIGPRQIAINNYGTTLKPILVSNCVGCHGDGSGRPQFAQTNDTLAYDAAAAVGGFINYSNPRQARAVERMLDDRHNCGGAATCDSLGQAMMDAIVEWNNKNIADNAAAANSGDDGIVALSDKERTPGRARYQFKVTEAGDYNVWLKMKILSNQNNDIRVRILDSNMRPMRSCSGSQSCLTTDSFFSGMSTAQIQDVGCEEFMPGDRPEFEWFTPSINDLNARRKWTLGTGTYYLELIEDEVNAQVDLVAISKNPEFNPAKNLVDEGNIQTSKPKIIKYDISSIINQPGTFEIEVIEKESGDAYVFRNPRFKGISGSNVRFKNIKILVNNSYEFTNSTYTKLNRVVNGMDSGILTTASLVALAINGPSVDSFAFAFEDLTLTQQPHEALDEDAPVPVEGRQCLDLDLFARTVMPVLNNFRLMLKDDYIDYTDNQFPSRGGDEAQNPTTYNCTTCHNEDHPYFKMTTFADGLRPGDPIPQAGLEKLCAQAISRVDFGNFERSLLLRGLNGTFNHPKLHFIQKANIVGDGPTRAFQASSTDPSGYATEFIGFRFEKWTTGEINLSNYSNQEDKEYLAQFLGRYKRVRYRTYDDPFALYDGETIADGDFFQENADGELVLRRTNTGRTQYDVIDPRNSLSLAPADRPGPTGPFLVKSACFSSNFQVVDGIYTDPCNNNANVITEFETVKSSYRDSIINWMAEEKRLYDEANQ